MSEKKVVPMEAHTNPALADLFASSDPVVAGFMARHTALLERVTVLERALEEVDVLLTTAGVAVTFGGDQIICHARNVQDALKTTREALDA